MSNIDDLKMLYGLVTKPKQSAEEQLAKIRERQRRERKEKLYSYPLKSRKSVRSHY